MKLWAQIGVRPSFSWPTKELSISFGSREVRILPETESLAPRVATTCDESFALDEAMLTLRRFLSALAWIEDAAVEETMALGGPVLAGMGRGIGGPPYTPPISPRYDLDHVPYSNDQTVQLALALYREALGVNSDAYRLLGFFKILNVLHPSGKEQKAWINATIDQLKSHEAWGRVAELRGDEDDIGKYLYESGRCAVAHAFQEPLIDPDIAADRVRIVDDLPVVKALAQHLIELELGIKTMRSICREHLYELDGFRVLLGDGFLTELRSGRLIEAEGIPEVPAISLGVRHERSLAAFERLEVKSVSASDGVMLMQCSSEDGIVKLSLALNFGEERLQFDPFRHVQVYDDGSPEALAWGIDQADIIKQLFGNGQLEIRNSETDELLGCCDPYIPVNCDVTATFSELDSMVEHLRGEIERRSQAQQGDASPSGSK